MDPNFAANHGFIDGLKADGESHISDPNEFSYIGDEWNFGQLPLDVLNFTNDPLYGPDTDPLSFAPHTSLDSEGQRLISPWGVSSVEGLTDISPATVTSEVYSSLEDTGFSETANHISQILMEENFQQKPCMFYDPLCLQVTENSFYDALKTIEPIFPNQQPLDIHPDLESPDGNSSGSFDSGHNVSTTTTTTNNKVDPPWHGNPPEIKPSSPDTAISGDYTFQFESNSISQKPSQPPNASVNFGDEQLDFDSSITELLVQNIFTDSESVLQFKRGLEEASQFLPTETQLVTGLESNPMSPETKKEAVSMEINVKDNSHGSKGRKNHEREDSDIEEGRSNKQSAVFVEEESEISDMFDRVLLSIENVPLCAEHDSLQNSSIKARQPSEQPHSNDKGRTRTKKQGRKKGTVDLRTLLVLCAQAVSSNDSRTSTELLKQIRQHSSALGDASQRLAHYFANGLEARLVGSAAGTALFYTSLISKRISASDTIKAYQVLINACPFKKFAHFFSNKMILTAAEKAETLHIIDFGILYGFQWPILIKFLADRTGGPPKLRITGIECPLPGFRPTERIEETGRHLANYCKRFNVPFEYNAIASQNWETIQIEDLKINSNEFLAVNCLMRFKNLFDETIEVNSPRNAVLNLIRKVKPDLFLHSIVNGSYNAPFFVTRFREALFHYNTMYDMLDTLIPRENEWRLMYEKEFLGREIMNVIACEGFERVERPETYKQWQVRNTRCGFRQLPLDKELMNKFKETIKQWYHRDFVLDEDSNWMLQGWKGRILFASSCWVLA